VNRSASFGPELGLLQSLRPRQWIKNGLLFAPLIFAQRGTVEASLLRALAGFGVFSLLASGVYLFNDVLDRERDLLHPEKKNRPIASGVVSVQTALVAGLALSGGAVWLGFLLGQSFGYAAAGYLALQVTYSVWLKHFVLLDVFALAAGFVLRVIAGALVISVPISNWLYLCTLLWALFLSCAKRRAEIVSLGGGAAGHRKSLAHYSVGLLDQMIGILAATTILAYALYTLDPSTRERFGSDWLKLTVPFVIFGLFRYLYLIHQHGKGGSPDKLLLQDLPLLVDVVLFLGVVLAVIY
jgi:4-hydroxybenzoate polyprenyltransferase